MSRPRLGALERLGIIVIVVLNLLNGIEYGIAQSMPAGNVPYMAVLAFIDAAFIAHYFMHVTQFWRGPEEHL